MRLLEYHYQDVEEPGWDFAPLKFGRINLLVGDTATGKTRLLNTIFNLGRFVAANKFKHGSWELVFEHSGSTYTWHLRTEKKEDDDRPGVIVEDNIWKHDDQTLTPIIERSTTEFTFIDKDLPKLSPQETSVSLLKEEEIIEPLHHAFSIILRRRFFHDALSKISQLQALPLNFIERMEKKKDLDQLFYAEMNLNANLYILSEYFREVYKSITDYYKKFFPFVQEVRITDLSQHRPRIAIPGHVPVFTIRERGSDKWVSIDELSSGMQKVLLILTDVSILPDGGVYIIDEYENSLGINAINFFPEFILELEKNVQFFITSHHPYIINEIPPDNWYVFHRKGMRVEVKYGEELAEKFGRSRQQAFIQLINDPFFSNGVE